MAQYLGVSQIETDSVSVTGGVCGPGVDSANTHLTFDLPLRTSLVPKYCRGSGTPTFTRASNAYVADHEGILRLARSGEARFQGARRVHNLMAGGTVIPTDDFTHPSWTNVNCTLVTGVADPWGGTKAARLTATSASAVFYAVCGNPYGSTAHTGMASLWVRRVSGSGPVSIFSCAIVASDITANLTTTWQRFAASGLFPGGNGYIGIREITTSGDSIEIAGPMLEIISDASNQSPSEFVSVGELSAPYHGAGVDGVKYFDTTNGNSVNSNVVTEAIGEAIPWETLRGLLSETGKTNYVQDSCDFSVWTGVSEGVSSTNNTTVAPDGTQTADTVYTTASTDLHRCGISIASSTGTKRRFSVFAKAGSIRYIQVWSWAGGDTSSCVFDLVDGVCTGANVPRIEAFPNGWWRCSTTVDAANSSYVVVSLRNSYDTAQDNWTSVGGETVYLWGGMLEADSESTNDPTSFIYTTGGTATRAVDLTNFPSANNAPTAKGTIFAEIQTRTQSSNRCVLTFSAASYGMPNGFLIRVGAQDRINVGGDAADVTATLLSGNFGSGNRKVAGTWDGTQMRAYAEGNPSSASNSNDYTGVGTTLINIGSLGPADSQHYNGTIRNIRIWSAVMPIRTDGTVASQISG